jgi:sulfite reductase (ferredoxin)
MSKISVEQIKAESVGLRGSLPSELANGEAFLSEGAKQLLKFHGSYQQEDRDARKGGEKHYQFMIRTKLPGGQLSAAQYLAHDAIAAQYGNDTLRITTRQGLQLYGVIKSDLRATIHALNGALVTTFGACGDVVRNVMACPAPTADPQRRLVQDYALQLSDALLPRTKAYHQIWVDGEALLDDEEDALYGRTYLPRKFKIAIAFPADNCVDIFTQDVGLVALFDAAGQHIGFNVLAGGGMGMTHNNEETFPRLADLIAFIEPQHATEVVKGIVGIHRDFGDRANRKHARLKYILQERGVTWFREELQSRLAFTLHPPHPMPEFQTPDHLGWQEQGDGKCYLGIAVENGRIYNREGYRLRDGLRAVVERFHPSIRLTPQQNLLLVDIERHTVPAINALLAEYNILPVEQLSGVRRRALACPALPTCGLAITEAERALPSLLDQIERDLAALGLAEEPIHIRMTGCPNGCARPYVAEIGVVGRSLNKYTIFLAGSANGTRLNLPFRDLVAFDAIAETLHPIFTHFRDTRLPNEPFGDFCIRVGLENLQRLMAAAPSEATTPSES